MQEDAFGDKFMWGRLNILVEFLIECGPSCVFHLLTGMFEQTRCPPFLISSQGEQMALYIAKFIRLSTLSSPFILNSSRIRRLVSSVSSDQMKKHFQLEGEQMFHSAMEERLDWNTHATKEALSELGNGKRVAYCMEARGFDCAVNIACPVHFPVLCNLKNPLIAGKTYFTARHFTRRNVNTKREGRSECYFHCRTTNNFEREF